MCTRRAKRVRTSTADGALTARVLDQLCALGATASVAAAEAHLTRRVVAHNAAAQLVRCNDWRGACAGGTKSALCKGFAALTDYAGNLAQCIGQGQPVFTKKGHAERVRNLCDLCRDGARPEAIQQVLPGGHVIGAAEQLMAPVE